MSKKSDEFKAKYGHNPYFAKPALSPVETAPANPGGEPSDGALDGSEYFVGKPIEVLQAALAKYRREPTP